MLGMDLSLKYRYGESGPSGSDPFFSNVVLLSHFDGVDASTTFVDVTGKAMTAVGNAQIDTAQSVFGGASVLFDGTTDRIDVADSEDWNFGTGAFTIEFLARFAVKQTNQAFLGQWGSSGVRSWYFFLDGSALKFQLYSGVTTHVVSVSAVPILGQWYHICAERNASGQTRLYVNGNPVASSAALNGIAANNSTTPLSIGGIGNSGGFPTFDFNGHMDELRITKGVARYDTDSGFIVQSSAHPDG